MCVVVIVRERESAQQLQRTQVKNTHGTRLHLDAGVLSERSLLGRNVRTDIELHHALESRSIFVLSFHFTLERAN